MSAFRNGFNLGFLNGICNSMFGGFGVFNWSCWNSRPLFSFPLYNFNNVMPYFTPTNNVTSIWTDNIRNYSQSTSSEYTCSDSISWNTSYLTSIEPTSYSWNSDFSLINNKSEIVEKNIKKESVSTATKENAVKKTNSPTTQSSSDCNATELKNKWKSRAPHLTDEFYDKVVKISKRIKCSPTDLMALMHSETNGALKPGKWNEAGNRAVGLIQFTDIAAKDMGTTLEKLEKMSAVEQLDYVEKFLVKTKARKFKDSDVIDSGTLYALVYLPAFADKDVIAQENNDPNNYYKKNKVLDVNGDGKITKTDLSKQLKLHYA